jgi:uncharacterized protein YjaZ
MGVVRTDKWLDAYKYKWNQAKTLQEKIDCQLDVIIQPLSDVFSTNDKVGLHHFLLQMGLFHPEQSIDIEYEKWTESVPWLVIQKQFIKLKKKWNGPEIKIYILPLTNQNPFLESQLGAKTGLTIQNAILLFIRSYTSQDDLLALITHEYHHICRLNITKMSESSMPLLESMIMEGLAEFAVKEEVGIDACASWTSRYDGRWNDDWYDQWLKPNLYLKGRKSHTPFLYGSEERRIPLWLGYYAGYKIVDTAAKMTDTTRSLLAVPAEKILRQSKFKG